MKTYKILSIAVASLLISSCNDIDEMNPEGNGLTANQLQESNELAASRSEASFTGMFTMMGEPYYMSGSRADDFGFIMSAISLDLEGSDMCFPNSGYNWFSVCGEYSSRYANYANPWIRYSMPYNQIKVANDIIKSFPADTKDPAAINKIAQAKAIRAFDIMALAQYFQFSYNSSKDQPCIPLVTESTTEFTNNPRATVEETYSQVISDLNYAVENLTTDRADKSKINLNVAYGLRARANLIMGNYAEAAADAAKAMEGYTPASIADVSTPSFYNINDGNWIWGIDLTADQAKDYYATSASWIGSFSASSYSAGVGVYAQINNLLYNKIPTTDVRKGWWVDENLHSPLLNTVSWEGVTGDAISTLTIKDVKEAFVPYTNVKFGMMSGVGSSMNDNDWPLMRVEEMILIQAEGLAKSGQVEQAKTILTNFVKTYRDPSYTIPSIRSFENEIWFQRRVELWGEGFAMSDIMRLQKPVVRYHDNNSNYPEAFRFNIKPDNGWLLMRFPQDELDTNTGLIDNEDGTMPVPGDYPELRDGVTD